MRTNPERFEFVRKMNVRKITFEYRGAKREWFTFMIGFCDICLRVFFLRFCSYTVLSIV